MATGPSLCYEENGAPQLSLLKGEALDGEVSVTARIRGGLGNQLFMYAMGRRLSLVNGVPLYLETRSGFVGDVYRRSYGLKAFNISFPEVARAQRSKPVQFASAAISLMRPFPFRTYHSDIIGHRPFDRRYLDLRLSRPVYLDGYWQDERYFSDIGTQLRNDLSYPGRHSGKVDQLAGEIRESESVAVHLRRLHMPLPDQYYLWALQRLKERLRCPRFFLFSDSTALVPPSAFAGEDVTPVEAGGEDAPHEDLYLMSLSRHFVIANSTFSWWGAWLGNKVGSIIVSPVLREWGMSLPLGSEWQVLEWSRAPG